MDSSDQISSFLHDLFVSYAHKDDMPERGSTEGWVTVLIEVLKGRLEAAGVQGSVDLWHDELLNDLETVSKQLENAVKQSAILLAVLSPNYLNSKWCGDEVRIFFGELEVREKSDAPAMIIEMLPVDRKDRPVQFVDRNTRQFWEYDNEAKTEIPLGWPILDNLSNEDYRRFLKHVAGIASILSKKIKTLRQKEKKKEEIPTQPSSVEKSVPSENRELCHASNSQVFINPEPLNTALDLANKVKEVLGQQKYQVFLPSSDTSTSQAGKLLTKSYVHCRAVVLVSPEFSKDWLEGQLRQLRKYAADRQTPLEFLVVVTQFSLESPAWLQESLDKLKLIPRKMITAIDNLQI